MTGLLGLQRLEPTAAPVPHV